MIKCKTCNAEIINGKVFQDRYFFNYHCSINCFVEYAKDFFEVNNEPEVTVIEGKAYYDEELDEDGNPIV